MTQAAGRWPLPADHPVFAGHFPGHPILPGALLLDMVLAELAAREPGVPGWDLAQAKFPSPVLPGETVDFAFRPGRNGRVEFELRAAGRVVASGSLSPHEEQA